MTVSAPAVKRPEGASAPAAPRFGNAAVGLKLAAADHSAAIFKSIVEIFLWAFLAQDILAMCLTRMVVSLQRGRIPYDPNTDPRAKDLPMGQQVRLWVQKNVQGLNWPNFAEESSRELATGPGVLAIPAIMFAIARRTFGKGAVELGYAPLTQMGHGFMDQLAKLPEGHILNESLTADQLKVRIAESGLSEEKFLARHQQQLRQAYQGEFKKFLAGLFDDQAMLYTDKAGKSARALDTATRKLVDGLRAEFAKQFGQAAPETPKTFMELIDQFAERYTATAFDAANNRVAQRRQTQILHALGEELEQAIVKGYNQSARLAGSPEKLYGSLNTLVRLPQVSQGKVTHVATTAKPIAGLMEELNRFKDVALQIGEEKIAGAGSRGYLEKTAEVGKKVVNRLVGKKMLLSAGSILLTGTYLIFLARFVQRHNTYPGERQTDVAHGAPAAPAQLAANAAAQPLVAARQPGLNHFSGFQQPTGGTHA